MPSLPPEWIEHFSAGVAYRLGSCDAEGRPGICRAQAALALPGGRVRVLVTRWSGPDVLDAIAATGQVALVMPLPENLRTLHLKGRDARVGLAEPGDEELVLQRRQAFTDQLVPLGYPVDAILQGWYALGEGELHRITFTISGAWNQSPGPGAGGIVELLP